MSLQKINLNMDNLIRIYDDVLDKISCEEIIEKFEDFHKRYETVFQQDGENIISFEQLRINDYDSWNSINTGLLKLFQEHVVKYKIDCRVEPEMWPKKFGFEAIRMKRYLANDYDRFDPHVDVLDYDSARRFLAFFVYLNDVPIAGETNFCSRTMIQKSIQPKRGRLLIFPPMWPWFHAGLKPLGDKKYIIHSYCHYV